MTDTPTDLHVVESPAPVGLSDAEIDAARELLPLAAETPAPEAVWQWLRQIAESKPDEMRARVAELEAAVRYEADLAQQAIDAQRTAWNEAIRAAATLAGTMEFPEQDAANARLGWSTAGEQVSEVIRTLLRKGGSDE